jgi:hypothetical protein
MQSDTQKKASKNLCGTASYRKNNHEENLY